MIFKKGRNPAKHRERRDRRDVDLATRYQLEGARDLNWRDCRVFNVSRDGLAAELFDATPAEVRAHRVIIELAVPRATLRPRAQVRHIEAPTDRGGVRVSVEFGTLSALENDVLDTLINA